MWGDPWSFISFRNDSVLKPCILSVMVIVLQVEVAKTSFYMSLKSSFIRIMESYRSVILYITAQSITSLPSSFFLVDSLMINESIVFLRLPRNSCWFRTSSSSCWRLVRFSWYFSYCSWSEVCCESGSWLGVSMFGSVMFFRFLFALL